MDVVDRIFAGLGNAGNQKKGDTVDRIFDVIDQPSSPVENKEPGYYDRLGKTLERSVQRLDPTGRTMERAPSAFWQDPRTMKKYPMIVENGKRFYEDKGRLYVIPEGELESGQLDETLTDPKEMAENAALIAGMGALGAAGRLARIPGSRLLLDAAKTTVPIELASNLTGGVSDLARLAGSAVKGGAKKAAEAVFPPFRPAENAGAELVEKAVKTAEKEIARPPVDLQTSAKNIVPDVPPAVTVKEAPQPAAAPYVDFLDTLDARFPQARQATMGLRRDRRGILDSLTRRIDNGEFSAEELVRNPDRYLTPDILGRHTTNTDMRRSVVDMVGAHYDLPGYREGLAAAATPVVKPETDPFRRFYAGLMKDIPPNERGEYRAVVDAYRQHYDTGVEKIMQAMHDGGYSLDDFLKNPYRVINRFGMHEAPFDLKRAVKDGVVQRFNMEKAIPDVAPAGRNVSRMSEYEIESMKRERPSTLKAVMEDENMRGNPHFVGESDPINGPMRVHTAYAEAQQLKKQVNRKSVPKLMNWISKYWTNDKALVEKQLTRFGAAGRDAIRKYSRFLHISGEAARQYDEASRVIFEGVDRAVPLSTDGRVRQSLGSLLDEYINAKRSIEIAKNDPTYVFTETKRGLLRGRDFADWIASLPKEVRADLEKRSEAYFDVMREQLNNLYRAGLLTTEQYQSLARKGVYYSPIEYMKWIDPEESMKVGKETVSVPSSGIKYLEHGDTAYINYDTRELLQDVIVRTQSRIARNDANKALLTIAKETPVNGFVRLHEMGGGEAPAGWTLIDVMVKGNKYTIEMANDAAQEWTQMSTILLPGVANALKWLTAAPITRAYSTGYNPAFAVKNLVRDVLQNVFVNPHYSRDLFEALGQMGRDLFQVAGDVVRRKGRYIDYIKEGGSMDTLAKEGRLGIIEKTPVLKQIGKVLAWPSETSESLVRVASRERALKNLRKAGMPEDIARQEATYTALSVLDFKKGGSAAKTINTWTPFFNASIQGTRSLFKAAKERPAAFALKISELTTLAIALRFGAETLNPEAYASIPDETKERNFILPFFIPYDDARGEKRYYYVRLPKDESQKFFSAIFEGFVDLAKDRAPRWGSRLWRAFNGLFPFSPEESVTPPLEVLHVYATNYDLWRGEKVWRGKDVEGRMEYTRYTPEIYKKIGEMTGLSPVRTQRAVEKMFPRNPYTSVAGAGVDLALGDTGHYEERAGVTPNKILTHIPVVQEFWRTSPPVSKKYEQRDEDIERKWNTRSREQTNVVDELSDQYGRLKDRGAVIELRKYLFQQPPEDRKYLMNRFKNSLKLEGRPDRSWWLDLAHTSDRARAEMFHERYKNASDEERRDLWRQLRKMKLGTDKDFRREFMRLQRGR